MRTTLISIFIITSFLANAGGNDNDIELEVNFSGMENGFHEGRTGILSVKITNHGDTTEANPRVSGGFITSLSGEGASPYFMSITENLDTNCDFGINFHVDPIPDWFYFMFVRFPEIPAQQSHTCQFRYQILLPNVITTSYGTNTQNDPNPNNNSVQITLRGFVQSIPVNHPFMLFALIVMLLALAFIQPRKSCPS